MKADVRRLGRILKDRREQLGLSLRELERLSGVENSTIVRFEHGAYATPHPTKLAHLAKALRLNVADLYALADYAVSSELPAFQPYLRSKYRDLPPTAIAELERSFSEIARRHGFDPTGPAPGEDEAPETSAIKTEKGGSHGPKSGNS